MADVVDSDEGAGTAGAGAGQDGHPGEPGPELGKEETGVDAGGPQPAGAAPDRDTDTDTAANGEADQASGAEAAAPAPEPAEVPAEGPAAVPQEAAEPVVAAAAGAMVISGATPATAAPAGPQAPSAASMAPGPAGPAGSSPPFGLGRRKALLVGGAAVVVVGGAVAAFAASGSSGGTGNAASGKADPAGASAAKTSASASAVVVPAALINTVPANGATGVDPSKPITVQVQGGTISSVELSGQPQTNGTLSTSGDSWTSDNVLSVDSDYQLTVTAKNTAGKVTTTTTSFRTLSPSATFGVSSVVPPRGSTVGVGQPIRVTFSNYVPQEYQAALEKACVVTTTPPVAGAWYWVSNSEDGAVVDWRPETFWPVNTQVSIDFSLDGVRLGEHQFGVENYKPAHDFTISDRDLRLVVDKDKFQATCYKNGQVIRTFPIDTGMTTAETFVTYTGTMAVLGKGNPVEMKGNYGPGDTYDDFVNWATQITWSGTYVHAAPWDPDIGYANDDSHGCVHCRTEDAEWFYGMVVSGDVVTINGSLARPVAVDNGICTFTLDWADVVKGSAYGPTLNGKPVSA